MHNHKRQGGLALEEGWEAKTPAQRVFTTLLGMIEVDAHNAWLHFHCSESCTKSKQHPLFTEALAQQLLENDFDGKGTRTRAMTQGEGSKPRWHGDGSLDLEMTHDIRPLATRPEYDRKTNPAAKKPKVRCHVCGAKASYYCATCTAKFQKPSKTHLFAVCGLSCTNGAACINQHFCMFWEPPAQ